MEGSRSSLCQQDASELFGMLESSDQQTVESVKVLIHENLSGTKDVWLIHGLLDYYIAVQSTRALDILVRVREPHDKHLFDRMFEHLRNERTRYHCLLLLSHLIHRQPSWLFKITQHRIFQILLTILKSEVDPPCLMCALFSIVSLLPMIPFQIGSYLNDIFEIFSRLAAWSAKKSTGVHEVYILHLQVGVYALFHRLYGMYPCNFLSYLRSYYGGREYKEENIRVFATSIKPMLERVRLHPLLVTACKDSEVSQKRWKRMATHDIVALCASISLDAVEGTSEDTRCRNTFIPMFSGQLATHSQESSMQFLSFSSMSSTMSMNVESNSLVNDATNNKFDASWTPSRVCALSTPPPASSFHNGFEERIQEFQGSESHSQVDNFMGDIETSAVTDPENIEISTEIPSEEKIELYVAEALEAKEEEDLVDKEVCELTSMPPASSDRVESRHDTPFRSTTQNLTDKTEFAISTCGDMAESKEDACAETHFRVQEHTELKMETLVRTMNRLRYFSQCGPPPEVSTECFKQTVNRRSLSCPNISLAEVAISSAANSSHTIPEKSVSDQIPQVSPAEAACCGSPYKQNALWNDSVPHQSLQMIETSYDHLIPLALEPLPISAKGFSNEKVMHSAVYKNPEYTPFYCSLSPAELLDRHLQMGSDSHLMQLCSIPLTSTKNADWTHFGGKPPADEIAISHTQIQLLHNQVMFERHRRETHAERNRRLLGKAKRSQIQEENTATLKDQVFLLEKENEDIKKELKVQANLYLQLENMKKQAEKEFSFTLGKLTQENTSLQYSNKKLQGLLVCQKEENDMLKKENQLSRSRNVDMQFELELLRNEVDRMRKMEKELLWLAKENTLLQEMNQQYKEKLELTPEPHLPDFEVELIKDAACSEIKNMKLVLDSKATFIDALKGKVANLEDELSVMKLKLLEQSQATEHMKATHKDEIMAREDRLLELQKIHHYHTAHILELYQVQEKLNADIEELKLQVRRLNDGFKSDVHLSASGKDHEKLHADGDSNENSNSFIVPASTTSVFSEMSTTGSTACTGNLETS